ncbi:MAG: hypothetical protein V1660_01325 [archaeon]
MRNEMKKRLFFSIASLMLIAIMLTAFVSADITLTQKKVNDVVAKELSQPATFALKISNTKNIADYFEFYTYVDAILSPRGAMRIEGSETKDVNLEIFPAAKLRDERKGSYTFVYYTKGQQNIVEQRMILRILPLKDLLSINVPDSITVDSSQITITISNNESIAFEKIEAEIVSAFAKSSQTFSLGAYEQKEINLQLDKNMLSSVNAGSYLATITLKVNDEATIKTDKPITVVEKANIITTEDNSGTMFNPLFIVKKENKGNIPADVEVVVMKNAFANSFTSFNFEANSVEKKGLTYVYKWNANIKPGQSFEIQVNTNYILPLGILFAILIVAIIITAYLRTDIVVKKKVVRVRSKTGEFAMKVMILIRARKNVSNIFVKERLPHLAELYERFGVVIPSRIDKAKGTIEWNVDSMQAGEETILSYIFYSKVSIVGRFELPKAFVSFKNSKGKHKEFFSNTVFFLEERHV